MNKRLLDQMTFGKEPSPRSPQPIHGWYGWSYDPIEPCSSDDLCMALWNLLTGFEYTVGYWKMYPDRGSAEVAMTRAIRDLSQEV